MLTVAPRFYYTRIYGAFRRWQAGGCFDIIFMTVVLRLHQTSLDFHGPEIA